MTFERRTAVVALSADHIARLLDLPTGYRVVAVEADLDPPRVRFLVHSDELPEVLPEVESPFLHTRETVEPCGHHVVTAVAQG